MSPLQRLQLVNHVRKHVLQTRALYFQYAHTELKKEKILCGGYVCLNISEWQSCDIKPWDWRNLIRKYVHNHNLLLSLTTCIFPRCTPCLHWMEAGIFILASRSRCPFYGSDQLTAKSGGVCGQSSLLGLFIFISLSRLCVWWISELIKMQLLHATTALWDDNNTSGFRASIIVICRWVIMFGPPQGLGGPTTVTQADLLNKELHVWD